MGRYRLSAISMQARKPGYPLQQPDPLIKGFAATMNILVKGLRALFDVLTLCVPVLSQTLPEIPLLRFILRDERRVPL